MKRYPRVAGLPTGPGTLMELCGGRALHCRPRGSGGDAGVAGAGTVLAIRPCVSNWIQRGFRHDYRNPLCIPEHSRGDAAHGPLSVPPVHAIARCQGRAKCNA